MDYQHKDEMFCEEQKRQKEYDEWCDRQIAAAKTTQAMFDKVFETLGLKF